MRNAAELRRDATATGWFNGPDLQYVGDGFTVPWEVALADSIPIGLTFFLYKQYLDARWLEASRLHDWLYTPYGGLIDVTRLEADNALREEILPDSVFDADIVYAAVRYGGAPYFGTSQTGVRGFPIDATGPNMAVAFRISPGGFTVPIKVVIVFQQATQVGASAPSIGYSPIQRVGGWTESVNGGLADLATLIGRLKGPRLDGFPPLLPARATILSNNASIVGVRLYQGGAGKGQFLPMSFPGAGGTEDIPSMALLCAAQNGGTPTVRRWTIRGVPDGQIVGGEFSPSSFYAGAVKQYFDALTNFTYLGQDTVLDYSIFDISGAGLVTLMVANPYAVGNIVTIRNTLDAGGVRRSGQFAISAIGPLGGQFTVTGWPYGATTGGKVSQPSKSQYGITAGGATPSVARVVTRKVGRPFVQFRGRHSKRRVRV